jgi:hypothetical protein
MFPTSTTSRWSQHGSWRSGQTAAPGSLGWDKRLRCCFNWTRANQALQEWRNQLRSSLHPMLFAGIYRAAAFFSNICNFSPVARATLLLAAPKITQGVFAAGLDYFTWKLAESVYGVGSHAAWTTVQYSPPYCPPRRVLTLALLNRAARSVSSEPMAMVLLHTDSIKLPRSLFDCRCAIFLAMALGP